MTGRDPGLQPERTALAWRRLSIALVASGLVATHLLGEGRRATGLVTAGAAAGVALVLLVVSQVDLAGHRDDRVSRSPAALLCLGAAAVVLLGAAGLALALG